MTPWWLLFPASMIVAPLVFAIGVRTSPDPDADTRRGARLTLWLVLATLLSLGAMLALWQLAGQRVAEFTWVLFFPLFFCLAMPAMRAKNPAWRPAHAAQPVVRTASLAGDRAVASPIPRWLWTGAWVGGVLLLLAIGLRPLILDVQPGGWTRWAIAMSVGCVTIPLLLIVTPAGIRAAMREPEPVNADRTPELLDAYAALRRTKAWLFAGLFLTLALGSGLMLVFVAWTDPAQSDAALGWIGAIGGSAIGIAGGVAGVAIDVKRTRINALLRRLEREQQEPA